jgi:hypothetical protein
MNVKDAITRQKRMDDYIVVVWNLKNFVLNAMGGQIIKKPVRGDRSVAQLARAPVSKTGGWGFESLQTCTHKERQSV